MTLEMENPALASRAPKNDLAGASIKSEYRPSNQQHATKNWLLSRLRSARAGTTLVQNYIDDIGQDLAADRISNEQAAIDLTVLESTPLLYLSSFLVPDDVVVA